MHPNPGATEAMDTISASLVYNKLDTPETFDVDEDGMISPAALSEASCRNSNASGTSASCRDSTGQIHVSLRSRAPSSAVATKQRAGSLAENEYEA